MKKVLFIAVVMLMGYAATAQIVTLKGSHANTDTLDDAGTVYLTTPEGSLNNNKYGSYDLQFAITNVSGTTAGTAILQGSIDGSNWQNVFKTSIGTDGVHCDSLTISGATNHIYNIFPGATKISGGVTYPTNAGRRLWLRIKFVGTGTQRSIVSGKLIFSEK